ncbi:MAG: hypothetical protein ACI83P_002606 [Janthinobacterium sp.]|jgi:hypothetical protein
MKSLRKTRCLLSMLAALTLAGCAGVPPVPGETLDTVKAKLGQPTAIYRLPEETRLEYGTGPFGQSTYMAHIGPDGRLTSYEQVLTGEKFATIKIGSATKEEVLHTLGRPAETSYLALPKLEVWSYRYKQSGVWDSMMHVHFDVKGFVRMMQNGPDRDKEERRSFFR